MCVTIRIFPPYIPVRFSSSVPIFQGQQCEAMCVTIRIFPPYIPSVSNRRKLQNYIKWTQILAEALA